MPIALLFAWLAERPTHLVLLLHICTHLVLLQHMVLLQHVVLLLGQGPGRALVPLVHVKWPSLPHTLPLTLHHTRCARHTLGKCCL